MFNKQLHDKLIAKHVENVKSRIREQNRKRKNGALDLHRINSYKDRVADFVRHVSGDSFEAESAHLLCFISYILYVAHRNNK